MITPFVVSWELDRLHLHFRANGVDGVEVTVEDGVSETPIARGSCTQKEFEALFKLLV